MCFVAALLAGASAACFAQQQPARDYPSRPIRLLVPFVPGGTVDFVARVLAQKIAPSIGQNVFVENRGGAGGIIGTEVVAKSPPNGYTILVASTGHASLPNITVSLPYDPVKDFAPISLVTRGVGSVLVVHPSVPVHTVREFIALAKAHPGKLSYGSSGVGSPMHFAAESFSMMAGTRMTHIPYKGSGETYIDLIAGRIEVGFPPARGALEHIRSRKLRPLGISAAARWSELPEVPTIDEAGVKGYIRADWYGIWFPAGTPTEYVTRMRNEVVKMFADPAMSRAFTDQGLIPVASTPEEFGKTVIEEIEYQRRLVEKMGLKPQGK